MFCEAGFSAAAEIVQKPYAEIFNVDVRFQSSFARDRNTAGLFGDDYYNGVGYLAESHGRPVPGAEYF